MPSKKETVSSVEETSNIQPEQKTVLFDINRFNRNIERLIASRNYKEALSYLESNQELIVESHKSYLQYKTPT